MSETRVKRIVMVSEYVNKLLDELQERKMTSANQLIAIAIDNELEREDPFDYDLELPKQPKGDFPYVEQANKILQYMRERSGMSKEMMCLLRHDMGVPSKPIFLLAFEELAIKGFLVPYKPGKSTWTKSFRSPYQLYFKVAGTGRDTKVKLSKEARDFQRLQQLKKKFGDK